MTPAIDLLKKKKIPHTVHQYKHDPKHVSYGLEAAEVLGVDPNKVFKTLMFCINGEQRNLAVAIIPVESKLNLKQAAKAMKAKKAEMADPTIAQKISGYVVGGISPLGQKKRLPTCLDITAQGQEAIYVSAGKRGLDLEVSPDHLLQLTNGLFAELTA
ncbi:Cys-tRNA(Pro) deacylase [Vibrio sp. VB16]|jgi:Cys-tRNA(Pro)/Cys-tRNA(Cys) deacylase|uniref:Cys-tRNA(Pro) deacylase n=1 Tax=Vibrio sp. VB16 TaxID=2785746 RepID=UPI00189EAF50|nr:Cys-tRNA(Pro) deacylase [Vibrio sp. VB16]UGA54102.1 Cys-tRNA(Pro) deacylase [Vibrio sp. VB16]